MAHESHIYCLDANVLIQAWDKYYSPRICPEYWDVLNELGRRGRIFLAEQVAEEINRTEDALSEWLAKSDIKIMPTDGGVTECWSKILAADENHKFLVAESKGRSLGDPWVISHALHIGATVVTKEALVKQPRPAKIKIPNVCENMGIRWLDDFQFVEELNIQFSCSWNE